MTRFMTWGLCAALVPLLTACGPEDGAPLAPTVSVSPNPPPVASFEPSLPRLADGPHLGMITGFDPLDANRAAVAAARYDQARAAGATIGRIQIDWAELETAPGEYDAAALDDAFAAPELAGMNLVVLLSTLDSEGLTVPDHLVEDGRLRDGLTLGSPEVVDSFTAFLDWLGPHLQQRDVWLLSILNEPKGPIDDGVVNEAEAVTFYSVAMDQWNEDIPEIGITGTFTTSGPSGIPDFYEAVRVRSDMISFNYYCLTDDIQVTGRDAWETRLAQMKANAGDREIFVQELGCPVGFSPQAQATSIGGSLENQVQFFDFLGEVFASDPQFRAATMFQIYDWSPELSMIFSGPLRDAGQDIAADRLEEWLATSGFLRWSDSFERPGWQTWLMQLERVRTAREQ
ncbi:MAG: hypothetical protein AAGL10_15565 [Pseudomonadota bacterium]